MKKIPFGMPLLGEAEKRAVAEVLGGAVLVHGPRMHAFEKAFEAFTGAAGAAAVANCTAALHLSHVHLGIGPGDEVIVPAQTHVATAHAVELCGAKPVFVDAEPRTGNIDVDRIEERITPRTRAISVVHFLGVPVAMDRVVEIAERHGLPVVEDCALALGTRYRGRHAGLWGDAGCFSFYPVKHMTTSEGGMIVSRDPARIGRLRLLRAFGVERKEDPTSLYDVTAAGYNYRLSEIQCALGIEQLKRMPEFLRLRRENYLRLHAGLSEIDGIDLFPLPEPPFESSWYCLSMFLGDRLAARRGEIVARLQTLGIGTSIYYPRPVPLFTYYRERYGYREGAFPVAERISARSIALPVGPHLGPDEMDVVVAGVKEAVAGRRA